MSMVRSLECLFWCITHGANPTVRGGIIKYGVGECGECQTTFQRFSLIAAPAVSGYAFKGRWWCRHSDKCLKVQLPIYLHAAHAQLTFIANVPGPSWSSMDGLAGTCTSMCTCSVYREWIICQCCNQVVWDFDLCRSEGAA